MQQQGVNVTAAVTEGGIMLEKNYGSIITMFSCSLVAVL